MKMCEKHWKMLLEAIKARGLWHLVAKSAEAAQEIADAQARGDDSAFEPLIGASMLIHQEAFNSGGGYLMNGEYCPVCEAMIHLQSVPTAGGNYLSAEQIEMSWIEGPSEAMLTLAREKSLMPKEQ
jgi:hypothetical protein